MSTIVQSLALLAANSSVVQIENARYQRKQEKKERREIKKKEEVKKISNWEKLDESVKTLLLTASTNGADIPNKPSISLTKIIQAKTGTTVRLILHQKYPKLNMNLDLGLCTAIARGLILSASGPDNITNLSPFFTPPEEGAEELSNEDLLKIDLQAKVGNGLEEKDVKLLTKQKKIISTNAVNLEQQLQNVQNYVLNFLKKTPSSSFKTTNFTKE